MSTRGRASIAATIVGLFLACPGVARAVPYKYVALGDSYSAGEGVDPYFRDGYDSKKKRQTGKKDNRCHRSTRGFSESVKAPERIASFYSLASTGDASSGKRVNKYSSDANVRVNGEISWALLACSGAKVKNVLSKTQGGSAHHQDQLPQLDWSILDASTSLITISVGGNDVGFSEIMETCARKSCTTKGYRAKIDGSIADAGTKLDTLYPAIRAKAPTARVLVLGYPQLLPESEDEQGCTKLRPWRGEQDMLREKEAAFNALIATKASANGFQFIDLAATFAGHEVCGNKGEWLNATSLKRPKKVEFPLDDESFHPKLSGHAAIAAAINTALAQPVAGPPVPIPVADPVLGIPDFMGVYGRGWGTSRPSTIFNGGVPSGMARNIVWSGWGTDQAGGIGTNSLYRPGGGYYSEPGVIELRATGLASCAVAPSTPAYTRLMARIPKVPGGPLGQWFPWSLDLCNREAQAASCDLAPPTYQSVVHTVTAWDTDCETARRVGAASRGVPFRYEPTRYLLDSPYIDDYALSTEGFTCSGSALVGDPISWYCTSDTKVVTFTQEDRQVETG